MRVLCTSDWHLGKKTENKSRLFEQRAVIERIIEIIDEQKIDVTVIAGDVFDTSIPSSEAEELFFEYAYKIGKKSLLVVLAGNHDDASRLCAPNALARACNVIMYGSEFVPFEKEGLIANENGIIYTKNSQTLRLAVLPYPSDSSIMLKEDEVYSEKVAKIIEEKCSLFNTGCINMFASHLFMVGGITSANDERELGSAKLLPIEILPQNCFTLLGHVHKPMTVSKSKNAYYSGSIMPYSFDDNSEKRVIVLDSDGDNYSVESVPLSGYRKCERVQADSFEKIEEILDTNPNLIEIRYTGQEALLPSDFASLRRRENFAKIVVERKEVKERKVRKEMSAQEIFEAFYEKKKGVKPRVDLTEAFVGFMAESESEKR